MCNCTIQKTNELKVKCNQNAVRGEPVTMQFSVNFVKYFNGQYFFLVDVVVVVVII